MYTIKFQTEQKVKIIVQNINKKKHTSEDEKDFIKYLANNPIKLDKNLFFLSREDTKEK